MAEKWCLSLSTETEGDRQRVEWLVKTLQHNPHVRMIEGFPSHRCVNLHVTFIEGQSCPRGSTLHSLDHTHGEKTREVTPKLTWLERVLGESTSGV